MFIYMTLGLMNSSAKSRLSSTYRKHLVAVKSRNTICHFKRGGEKKGVTKRVKESYAKLCPRRQSWRRINDDKQVNARRSVVFGVFKTSFITPGFLKRKEAWMAVG